MDMHFAEASRTIDAATLGLRLRNARIAAGLKQSDVAAGEVTAAYISRIESGQRRPEFGLLERLAERLHVDLAALLDSEDAAQDLAEVRVEVDHAELTLLGGGAADALDRIDVVERLHAPTQPDVLRQMRRVRALAFERLGQIDEAIRLLEELYAEPVAESAWLQTVISLSRCYRISGDVNQAIAVGEKALPVISDLGLEGTTESIQVTITLAGAYTHRGDLGHAYRLCLRCADQADELGDAVAKGSAYWNASIVESRRGHHEASLALAERALVAFDRGEDSRNVGRLRAQIADVQLRMDPPDAAGALVTLERAERELTFSAARMAEIADVHLLRVRAQLLLGDHESARTALEAARDMEDVLTPTMLAELQVVSGAVAAAAGDVSQAEQAYRAAAAHLERLGGSPEVTRLWFELGARREDAGDLKGAIDAFRRGAAVAGLSQEHRTRSVSTSD